MFNTAIGRRAALASVVLLSFCLGFCGLGDAGTWPDEGLALLEATGQSPAMPDRPEMTTYLQSMMYVPDQVTLSQGTFRPADLWRKNSVPNVLRTGLYFDNGNGRAYALLLHFWVKAFGLSSVSVRLTSVIFTCATVMLVYFLVGYAAADDRLALLASLLTALSPLLIVQSRVGRSHSMAAFCATCSTLFMWHLLWGRKPPRLVTAIGYGVISSLAVAAHFFTLYVLAAQVLFVAGYCHWTGKVQIPWRHLLIAFMAAVAVASFFGANGLRNGLQRGALQERRRVESETQRLLSDTRVPRSNQTILITPSNVASEMTHLLAHLFNVRSAVASPKWRSSRTVVLFLLLLSLGTPAIYLAALRCGYLFAQDSTKRVVWLCMAIVACGIAYSTIMAVFVMKTIIPFGARSHLWMIPCISVLLAVALRGVLSWPPLFRYPSLGVLAIQWLLFGAIALRSVFIVGYAESIQVRLPTGNYETAERIRAVYRPGDVVEYQQWDDAVKVNLYLQGTDVVQRVDTSYLERGLGLYNRPRTIELHSPTGKRIVLWKGVQNDGALLPFRP